MEPSIWIAGLSAIAALVSAAVAIRSSASSRRSAQMAEHQAQLAYQELVGRWLPKVSLEVAKVSYRWSSGAMVWRAGEHAPSGVDDDALLTLEEAEAKGLHVEVVLECELVNHGGQPVLLTFHDDDAADIRYPLQNQRLFLVDGCDTQKDVLPAGERKFVTWIDRRTLEEWREHHVAHEERNVFDDAELRPPSGSRFSRIKEFVHELRDPYYSPYLEWKAAVQRRSGFRIVIDTRVADRIPEVWEVRLGKSPIAPYGRDEVSGKLRWRIGSTVKPPVDDDVAMYRCYRSTVLAQIETPRMRTVPGRF